MFEAAKHRSLLCTELAKIFFKKLNFNFGLHLVKIKIISIYYLYHCDTDYIHFWSDSHNCFSEIDLKSEQYKRYLCLRFHDF